MINTNIIVFDTEDEKVSESAFDSVDFTVENEFSRVINNGIVLEGKTSELCSIWQVRRNFLSITALLASSAFCFFLINF